MALPLDKLGTACGPTTTIASPEATAPLVAGHSPAEVG
jgi:hypothetical protein